MRDPQRPRSSATAPADRRGPGRPRQDRRGQAVRHRLIQAATRLFARRGFGEVSIREISAAADVTPAMISYYFDGKRGLYEAVFDSVFERLIQQIRELAEHPPRDSHPVEEFLRLYISTLAQDPWIPQLIVRDVITGDSARRARFIERFASRLAALVPALLRNQMVEGRLRRDLDPTLTLISLIGAAVFPYLSHPVTGSVLGVELDEGFRDRLIAHTSRLFLEGALPADARP